MTEIELENFATEISDCQHEAAMYHRDDPKVSVYATDEEIAAQYRKAIDVSIKAWELRLNVVELVLNGAATAKDVYGLQNVDNINCPLCGIDYDIVCAEPLEDNLLLDCETCPLNAVWGTCYGGQTNSNCFHDANEVMISVLFQRKHTGFTSEPVAQMLDCLKDTRDKMDAKRVTWFNKKAIYNGSK